ncbi:MAG: STAS domain-containing protein [Anaerolineae bacterium]|nr:STAS domain-containing protein [Anaerolineae bacterium]
MNITQKQFKRCDLISVEGRIDSATAPQLAEALEAITAAGRYKIILDCCNVSFISSAGLRVLVNTQKNCKRYNRGELVLAQIPENIRSTLDLVGFTELFKIFNDTLSAVGYF